MPATIVFNGTNITEANNNTGFSVIKRDGTGGTPTAISEVDVFIQGTGSCSVKVSNQGIILWFDNGSGIDMTVTNRHLYIWVNMLAAGLMGVRDSTTVPGLAIVLGTTTANRSFWAVHGRDTYPGGWVRLVLDVNKAATFSDGTGVTKTSVQFFGIYCNTQPNVAKFDNLVIDRIDYGEGLRVYGTSTTDDTFGDILAADQGNVSNKYGIITSKQGTLYLLGGVLLGDNVSTNTANLTDINKIIVYEDPRYYNGTVDASTVASTLYKFSCVGNGTGARAVQFGKKVGTGDTARGRNGIVLLSAGPSVAMDFDDGSNGSDVTKLYGCTFRDISGSISWGTKTGDECIGNTFDHCAQVDLVGGVVTRNTNFLNNSLPSSSALLWNSSIDIKNCNFIANTDVTNDPASIQHTTNSGDPFSYDNLQFSGNDYDVYHSAGSGQLDINKDNGSNPSTSLNTGTGTTVFAGSVSINITGLTEGSRGVMIGSGGAEDGVILLEGFATSAGEVAGSFSGATPQNVIVRARNSGIIAAAVLEDSGTGFTDYTNDARDKTGTNDVVLLPATVSSNDSFNFGGKNPFGEIEINITTAGSTYVLTWEYWNGAWTALTVTDSSNSFQTTGWHKISFTKPSDWATTTINSQGPFYYVRARVTTGGGTQPFAEEITLNKTVKYYPYNNTSTILSSTGLTIPASWIIDTTAS